MTKPSNYFKEGFNCAESVIKCYNKEFNDNIPLAIGSGMGGGACSGSLCGAVNGSIVVIGYLKGRKKTGERGNANIYVQKLIREVRNKYPSEICRDLKANRVSCGEIIDFSYEVLKKLLKEDL